MKTPPYIEDKAYTFQYNQKENSSNFNEDLLIELKKLNNKGVKWMMTQIDTPDTQALFKGYKYFKYINLHAISIIIKTKKTPYI